MGWGVEGGDSDRGEGRGGGRIGDGVATRTRILVPSLALFKAAVLAEGGPAAVLAS